jgi:hypothetical protein
VDPAGDIAHIALLKENNKALWKRVEELEGQIGQPRITGADLETELQRIYDSEINIRIDWFWDGGVTLRLGDEIGGYLAEETVGSVADAVQVPPPMLAHPVRPQEGARACVHGDLRQFPSPTTRRTLSADRHVGLVSPAAGCRARRRCTERTRRVARRAELWRPPDSDRLRHNNWLTARRRGREAPGAAL